MKKVLFLDRDGVINVDTSYLYKIEDFQWIEGAKEALKLAVTAGYELIVVTNQSGIARGYFQVADMKKLHSFIAEELAKEGAPILDFYYCPHLKESLIPEYALDCECRKPKPGMLLKAFADYSIDKEQSLLVGDSKRDIEAAVAAGLRGYLFEGGNLKAFMEEVLEKENNINKE